MKRTTPSTVVIAVVLFVIAAAAFLPFLWMLLGSFKTDGQILGHPDQLFPTAWTAHQYVRVVTDIPFFRFLLNSLVFAGGVTLFSLCLDSAAGYAFAKLPFPGRQAFFLIVLVTLMIPFQVVMVPLYLLVYGMHGLNTFWGLILPRITNAFGIYFMRQFFLGLPNELLDAGRIDGLREFGIFRRVALPMTTSALSTLGVFHFMYNWNDFLWPLLVTSTQDMRTLPVGLALFTGEHVQEHGPIIAGAVLSILPILLFFLLAQKTFMRGIALTGIKE
ncbi:MAG TPA: carbohydrate ABC transporter permease [Spirochaetia bacterium]